MNITGTVTIKPTLTLRKIRIWGDPKIPFSTGDVQTSNFQAIMLYLGVGETGWSGVTTGLYIPHDDMLKIEAMQKPDPNWTAHEKIQYLASRATGKVYLWTSPNTNWETDTLMWGIIALGGNIVQVERYETINGVEMARLVGFTKNDWNKPIDELIATGLVHQVNCAGRKYVDGKWIEDIFNPNTPHGVVFNPFFSPKDWQYSQRATGIPDAFYIPTEWLESV